MDDLRKRVATERESLPRKREVLALSLGLDAKNSAVEVAQRLAQRHNKKRFVTEKTIKKELLSLMRRCRFYVNIRGQGMCESLKIP